MDSWLERVAREMRSRSGDFAGLWAIAANHAADMVEIRHVPPLPELDGFRTREGFTGYVMEEARVFPQSFLQCAVAPAVEVEEGMIVWNPLSLSGPLKGSGRHVDIRFRVELHFHEATLVRVVGMQTGETAKADIIDWLWAVESIGGFNPPAALPATSPHHPG